MPNDKTLYWIAICLMGVGLGNSFVNHHRDFGSNVGRHAMVIADFISGRAQSQSERAELVFDRTQAGFDRSQALMDRAQARIACLQSRMAQRQAALDRAQALRTRLAVDQKMRKIVISVPEIPSQSVMVNAWDDDSDQ